MWLALVLPLLVLPALVGLSRFEQRVMGGVPRTAAAGGAGRAPRSVATDRQS